MSDPPAMSAPPSGHIQDGLQDGLQDGWMHEALGALLPRYGLGGGSILSRLTVSENTTFLARDGASGRQIVLRVHRPGYHTRAEILSELDWIAALHAGAIVETARPIALDNGEWLACIQGDGAALRVSAFSFLAGEEPVPGSHLVGRFEELGAISARLHDQARGWQRPEGFTRKRWDFRAMFGADPIWGDWRPALPDQRQQAIIKQVLQQISAKLDAYGHGADRFGLIHGDLRLANLLDDGRRLAVIDFDDCGFGWFAYDFAAAISFHEEDASIPDLRSAWLAGYRRVSELTAQDEAMLETFVMMRRLLLTAWLVSRAGNDTQAQFGPGFAQGTLRLAQRYLG